MPRGIAVYNAFSSIGVCGGFEYDAYVFFFSCSKGCKIR